MQEKTLYRFALVIALSGFIILVGLYVLQEPKIYVQDELVEDKTVVLQGLITDLSQTPSGTVLTLQRTCETTGFFKGEVPELLEGKPVSLTVHSSGDFIEIKEIQR